mmetsp:Transcript_66246/g.215580  ORF Transcript_66246/g.215580 Transcript_66246/m.215580 type:complete len:235 (-) Transcript_66246:1929-2633(-)
MELPHQQAIPPLYGIQFRRHGSDSEHGEAPAHCAREGRLSQRHDPLGIGGNVQLLCLSRRGHTARLGATAAGASTAANWAAAAAGDASSAAAARGWPRRRRRRRLGRGGRRLWGRLRSWLGDRGGLGGPSYPRQRHGRPFVRIATGIPLPACGGIRHCTSAAPPGLPGLPRPGLCCTRRSAALGSGLRARRIDGRLSCPQSLQLSKQGGLDLRGALRDKVAIQIQLNAAFADLV